MEIEVVDKRQEIKGQRLKIGETHKAEMVPPHWKLAGAQVDLNPAGADSDTDATCVVLYTRLAATSANPILI